MPGTDICSLCFSSWAWRRAASLSSRKRSVVSSPANSCMTTRDEDHHFSYSAFISQEQSHGNPITVFLYHNFNTHIIHFCVLIQNLSNVSNWILVSTQNKHVIGI
ncbi:hypothetical protein XENOCAPTIV_022474 [Xenoophorus captivus]|uniref:Uncharacterized protein n=1 Tax=Xenoophorus captivus TaxID=1517983 RepID=A0ABV0RD34_9TELE